MSSSRRVLRSLIGSLIVVAGAPENDLDASWSAIGDAVIWPRGHKPCGLERLSVKVFGRTADNQ
jgi:hypothetical protein